MDYGLKKVSFNSFLMFLLTIASSLATDQYWSARPPCYQLNLKMDNPRGIYYNITLQWHQMSVMSSQITGDCVCNRLFRLTSEKTKALCEDKQRPTNGFSSQPASKIRNVSMPWSYPTEWFPDLKSWSSQQVSKSTQRQICVDGLSSDWVMDCVCRCLVVFFCDTNDIYCQISNISRTKSQNLHISRLVLQLSLPNSLKPGVKWKMKMYIWVINNFIA